MTSEAKSFPGLEFKASKLKEALDGVKTNPRSSTNLLKYCEATEEDFCQAIVKSSKNGWRAMRFNALCASVVSTTMLANRAKSDKKNPKNPDDFKGTADLDHRGIIRQVSIFIEVQRNEETNEVEDVKLRDELPTTALEADCCLTKKSWDTFHRAMLCLNVEGHSEAPKWKAMNKKLKTYLNILSWLFGRGALAKAGESPADFGERLWNECRSFLPLLMKVSGRTVGVTRFESTKAWKNLDSCLCRFRWNKVTELEEN